MILKVSTCHQLSAVTVGSYFHHSLATSSTVPSGLERIAKRASVLDGL